MKATLITLGLSVLLVSAVLLNGCGKDPSDGSGSEVATSIVSGAVSNSDSGSGTGRYVPISKPDPISRLLNALDPIQTAHAFTLTCSGGTDTCTSGTATIDPYSCSITYAGGRTASSVWTGGSDNHGGMTWAISGTSCTCPSKLYQLAANCVATHQNASGQALVRTITGPLGNTFAITHDTTTPSGWDTSITTSNGGVIITCGSSGCATGRSVVISGSHITGTKDGAAFWDHTVSTVSGSPIVVTGEGASRVIQSGSVVTEHNLAKFDSTTVFNGPLTHTANCCFPVSGSVTTTYKGGKWDGKSETLTFSSSCGEATLTDSSGKTSSYTLTHCI